FQGNDLQLGISVLNLSATKCWSRWRIIAREVVDSKFVSPLGDVELHSEHILARQHTDPRLDLYFVDRSLLPAAEIAGNLFLAHVRVADWWIPFRRYLNRDAPLDRLLDGGSGKLAEGPNFIIEAYRGVLETAGMRVSVVGKGRAGRWDGTTWVQ